MRVAIVTEVFMPAVDGVVTRLRRTLEELERAGDDVLLVAPDGAPATYAGTQVAAMPAHRMPLYPDGVGYPVPTSSTRTHRAICSCSRRSPRRSGSCCWRRTPRGCR
jgi:hypothetical protein